MSGILQWLEQGRHWFIQLSTRERWLVLTASWTLLAWGGLLIYQASVLGPRTELQQRQQQLNTQLAEQQQLTAELSHGLAALSRQDQASPLARLTARLERLNDNVNEKMRTLVEPEQMSGLLLAMLEQSQGLELLELSNEAPLLMTAEDDSQALYQHNLTLVLSGSYLSLLDYVQRLELLSGRIFWRGLEFELDIHPSATIRLDFFTISQHKELLRG